MIDLKRLEKDYGLEAKIFYKMLHDEKYDFSNVYQTFKSFQKDYEEYVYASFTELSDGYCEKYGCDEELFVMYYDTWIEKLRIMSEKDHPNKYGDCRLSFYAIIPEELKTLLRRFGQLDKGASQIRGYYYSHITEMNDNGIVRLTDLDSHFENTKSLMFEQSNDYESAYEMARISLDIARIHFGACFNVFSEEALHEIHDILQMVKKYI